MPKPNFLIIGAKKSGTTLLYELLGTHPCLWLPEEKEPDYFIPPNWGHAERWNAYLALFDAAPVDARWIGEASAGYTTWPVNGDAARRIGECLGRPKLIYILRDPVERALSNFEHSYLRGFYEPGMTVARAIEEDAILVSTSRYAAQLERYDRVFGGDAVHIVLLEELATTPRLVLEALAKYLELPPEHPDHEWPDALPTVNSGRQNAASVRADRMLGRGMLRQLVRRLPPDLKERIRSHLPLGGLHVPAAGPADVEALTRAVADDLGRLRDRLGPRIDVWPTVQRLR